MLGDFAGRKKAVVILGRYRRRGQHQGGFSSALNLASHQGVGRKGYHSTFGQRRCGHPGFGGVSPEEDHIIIRAEGLSEEARSGRRCL